MKVLFIASMYSPFIGGGAELVLQNQAEVLAARGHKVYVLTLGTPGTYQSKTSLNGVDIIRVGIKNIYFQGEKKGGYFSKFIWHILDIYNFRMSSLAKNIIYDLRPDVIAFHNIPGWSAAVWQGAASTQIPTIQILHDQYARCIRSNMFKKNICRQQCVTCSIMRMPHKNLSKNLDAVVGVSKFIVANLTRNGYFQNAFVKSYIKNVSHLDTREILTPPLSGEEIVYGFIGTINPSKGIENLLKAFLNTSKNNWKLLIAGSGNPEYINQLRENYKSSRIIYVGHQNPSSFFQCIDVCVVPSLWQDTLPSVVFESLIHGRPVLGARRGGIIEMLDEEINGMMFDPESPKDLGELMHRFAVEIDFWRKRSSLIKHNATQEYCNKISWAEKWENLFLKVINDYANKNTTE